MDNRKADSDQKKNYVSIRVMNNTAGKFFGKKVIKAALNLCGLSIDGSTLNTTPQL